MTELLEKRLSEINEKLDYDICELADVKFMLQFSWQQANVVEGLREAIEAEQAKVRKLRRVLELISYPINDELYDRETLLATIRGDADLARQALKETE